MRLRKLKKSSDKRFPFFHSNKRFPVLSQGNWAKLKNIYPCGFTIETATVQKIPLSDNVRSFV